MGRREAHRDPEAGAGGVGGVPPGPAGPQPVCALSPTIWPTDASVASGPMESDPPLPQQSRMHTTSSSRPTWTRAALGAGRTFQRQMLMKCSVRPTWGRSAWGGLPRKSCNASVFGGLHTTVPHGRPRRLRACKCTGANLIRILLGRSPAHALVLQKQKRLRRGHQHRIPFGSRETKMMR